MLRFYEHLTISIYILINYLEIQNTIYIDRALLQNEYLQTSDRVGDFQMCSDVFG